MNKRFIRNSGARSLGTSAFAALALVLVGCGTTSNSTAQDEPQVWPPVDGAVVHVQFEPVASDFCPVSVLEWSVDLQKDAGKNKYIFWRAQKQDSSGKWVDLDIEYEVFFDPFKKADAKPVGSDDGLMKSAKLDEDSPNNVFYKYTIYRDSPDCKDKPLDPFVRVTH